VSSGCSSGQRGFTPSLSTPSSILKNSSVQVTLVHTFKGGATDGAAPISGLLNVGNVFYGTTGAGGRYGKGTVFSIAPDGSKFTVLYSFKTQDGTPVPAAGLTNVGGTFYGETNDGGTGGNGTVFSITPAGGFKRLYSFKGGNADGAIPAAGLTNVRGTLYGTTASGGRSLNGACVNCGTVFSVSTSGKEKVLYFFGSKPDDGGEPRSTLVNVKGKLYGTTSNGGIGGVTGNGTIFSVTTAGRETVLYKFKSSADGSCSFGCDLANVSGTLYGTARFGGKNHVGSVFTITRGGTFKNLYSASASTNAGGEPLAPLTNVAGTLYSTMSMGPLGANRGTVFSITKGGALTVLYTFTGENSGATPSSSLVLAGGKLYGTTAHGGSADVGTIYSLSGF
jgi:uncharacterized repeat protein (TIGR03803 family)